jgi:enamine deaminase RidA (YjgF/YER057c/UK114 family)
MTSSATCREALQRLVRDELLGTNRLPASTAVQVVAPAGPELLLEIEALALAEHAGAR